jgi:hypothetical protein
MKLLPALFLSFLAALSAPGLDWKTQSQSIKAAPLQRTAETEFEFTNTSDKPVTITSIDTSCDCTEATPSARTIAPGAQGTIKAHFSLTGAAGKLQRLILVGTDEGQPPTQLTVELQIPEVAHLTPRAVEWKVGADAQDAVVDIEIAPGLEANIESVRPTNERFTTRLEVVEPGRHFRLHLAPKDASKPANAAIRIYARTTAGEELVFSAYANVR